MKKAGKGESKRKRPAKKSRMLPVLMLSALMAVIAVLVVTLVVRNFFVRIDAGGYALPSASMIGIDISHHQDKVDWDELQFRYNAEGFLARDSTVGSRKVDFVIIKATDGRNHIDNKFRAYKRQIRSRGFILGAYHYFKPGVSPEEQAYHFVRVSGLDQGDMLPVIDVEERGHLGVSQMREAVLEWLNVVEKVYGCPPIIYCNIQYWSQYFSTGEFARYPLWIASYSRMPITADYVMWQQTDRGIVAGISRPVDIDVFNGSRRDFRKILIP